MPEWTNLITSFILGCFDKLHEKVRLRFITCKIPKLEEVFLLVRAFPEWANDRNSFVTLYFMIQQV